jgi:hypothetical protein
LRPKPLSKEAAIGPSAAAREFPPLGVAAESRATWRNAAAAAVAVPAARGDGVGGGIGGGREILSASLRPILVVTSHIVWNSNRGDVKLQQLYATPVLSAHFCNMFRAGT